MKIKVILSTGIGPLYFMKSAVHIAPLVKLKVIQSWIPKKTDSNFVKLLSKLNGHKHLAIGLKKRNPKEIAGNNYSCATPDFLFWGLKLVNKYIHYPSNQNIAGWAWELFGRQSRKYITQADIFHVRSGAGQGGAILQAKANGMKVIVDHSIAHPAYMDKHLAEEYIKNGQSFDLGMNSPLFRFTDLDARMADCILVNSFFVKKTFIEQGFSEDKIKVVHQGVREDFIGLKTDYSTNGKIKLLFTGGFGFRKGGEYILKALQMLEAEGFQFEMNIVGSFTEASQLIKNIPIKSVNFVGFLPQVELKKFFIEADIYVFPSLCEGCASSGMEAMAAGMPVIATEESGLPIVNNEDGIIIPSKDYLSIYSSIKALSCDKEKREYIGRNAALKIKTNYTWDNYANSVNEIYHETLNFKLS